MSLPRVNNLSSIILMVVKAEIRVGLVGLIGNCTNYYATNEDT